MEHLTNILKSLLEPIGIIVVLALLLFFNTWIFRRIKNIKIHTSILKNSISTLILFIGILTFILSLPIDIALKGQIISFLAIIVSAGIALSSTTVLGNLIAGIMNNSMKRFRNGDLIKIGDFHGRVTKKSIFHTEIQLEDSNFITIPNLYIATTPVKLTRKSDSVISTSVSLGYDISRIKIEKSLKEAAILTGLKDPYVYITLLGDYSVTYKVHGFLEDSSKYFSANSLLNSKVMDVLHENKIEIASPAFMNQRNVEKKNFIPKDVKEKVIVKDVPLPEDLVFDEAIKSEKIENKKDHLEKLSKKQELLGKQQKNLKKEDEIKEKIKKSIKDQSENT